MDVKRFDDEGHVCRAGDKPPVFVLASDYDALRAQLAALQREHAASAARVVALEALNSQAARLLRDYAGDAHDEDVPDVQRWLAVYESRQKREALAQPDAAQAEGEL